MMAPFRRTFSRRNDGFAIVLVLAVIVLLVGVALAFFSNALLQKQISQSSASRVKTDIFAEGALDTIVSDFKAEIKAGSVSTNIVTGSVTTTLYFPANSSNMVPALAGSSGTNGLENLLKRSSGTSAFSAGAANRSSALSSTNESGGGRSISLARWNKPLLLPATSATDLTPTNSTGFVAPDWVFVSRDGSNPTAWSDSLRVSKTNAASVVGRYAYAIYDEGGLLDVNAAGVPSTIPAATKNRKGSITHSDLAVLFEQAGFTASRATQIVDALVAWRNEATLQGGTAAFDAWAVFNPKGFLTTANTNLTSSKSDRIFTSRQQLQKFLLEKVAVSGEAALMQKALQYLATFTRDPNEPSLVKVQSVDSSLPGYSANAPQIQTVANGGNVQSSLDAFVNPPFPLVRVKVAFPRNDGSEAALGEPLVKERFALSRLSWLTYKGPSASRNQADPDIQALINTHGVPWAYLQQGTAQNIQKYFGLRWVADASSELGKWVYDVHNGAAGSGPTGSILRLGAPGDADGLANLGTPREPDFFELLKATVNAGSKAKASTLNMGTLDPADYQAQRDVSGDYAILQLGANIIAQSRVDGFGVRIAFDDGVLPAKEFYGVQNNPYLYRVRWGTLKIRKEDASLPLTGTTLVVNGSSTTPAGAGILRDPGASLFLLIPEIWNPHDSSAPMPGIDVNSSLAPTTFRIVVDSTDPDTVLNGGLHAQVGVRGSDSRGSGVGPKSNESAEAVGSYGQPPFTRARGGTGAEITGSYSGYLHVLKPGNTAMTFSVPNRTTFREPTLLARYNLPSGSNLRIDSSGWNAADFPETVDYLNVETTSGLSFTPNQGFTADVNNPLVLSTAPPAGTQYVGIPVGLFPSLWVRERISGSDPTATRYIARSDLVDVINSGMTRFTFRLQYRDPTNANNWVTYDSKYGRINVDTWTHNILGNPGSGGMMQWSPSWAVFADPRTSRFGAISPVLSGLSSNSTRAYAAPGAAVYSANDSQYAYATSETTAANVSEWLDQANGVLIPNRPNFAGGWYHVSPGGVFANQAPGWNTPKMVLGLLAQNSLSASSDGKRFSSPFGTDSLTGPTGAQYYADADNVVRRAAGAYASTALGLPIASTLNPSGAVISGQAQSRPWILQRPFRSVAELGYVFSDTPWKNLDFFTPESGDAGLLDVFCVSETENQSSLVAGKVNLNTRQAPVLKALMAGAYRNEQTPASPMLDRSVGGVTEQIASALVKRTVTVSGTSGPLTNPSELVGTWAGTSNAAPIDGSSAYGGFSKDLGTVLQNNFGGSSTMTVIQRFRESAIRPLANVGTTRVWNVLVDLVAQTGKFSTTATDLAKFTVEGEQRYWMHVTIDRLTGEVLDRQIEIVKE